MKRVDRSKKKKEKRQETVQVWRMKRSFIIFSKILNSATKVLQWNYSLRGSRGRVRDGWLATPQAASLSPSPGLQIPALRALRPASLPHVSMICSVRCETVRKWGIINSSKQRPAGPQPAPGGSRAPSPASRLTVGPAGGGGG